MSRPLTNFSLKSEIKELLLQCGFSTQSDVAELSPLELAAELSVAPQIALGILKTLKASRNLSLNTNVLRHQRPKSALELHEKKKKKIPIFTLCEQLDMMLGGGIPIGQLTEFCGVPGIGKTQLCMQIACDAMIPGIFGGADGAAVYIDTEGSFLPDRALSIAQGLCSHISFMCKRANRPSLYRISDDLTAENIMKNIYYFRVFDYIEQLSVIRYLSTFLEKNPKVRVVIMDSVAFHFRRGFNDYALRSRILKGMAQRLLDIARKFNLAVVLSNQVTTKFVVGTNSTSKLAPALGTSWAHSCTNRIMLFWNGNIRCAQLLKSPTAKACTIAYQVLETGIRDITYEAPDNDHGLKRKRNEDNDESTIGLQVPTEITQPINGTYGM